MNSSEDKQGEDLKTDIRQALARGYCRDANARKVLDPDLVDAMAEEAFRAADYYMALRFAAISTAAGQNTPESAKQRIGRENPFWTPAYADVCAAVDREMEALSSCAAIARILQQRRPMRGLRSDEVVEAVPVWAFEDTPEQAPVPESGPINAAGQEVETGGVSSHGPGPQAVTDEESTVPAPAAPSTPQPEAPTPCKYSGGTCARNYCRQTTRCQAHEALVESYEQRKVSASSAITRSVMIPEEPDEDVVEAILSCLETF